MSAVLYAVPASHPCACVEAALRIKGMAYRRVDLPPLTHIPFQLARFGARTVPGVVFADGERVSGSRTILRALEARVADPPLLPADRALRALVEQAEEWGDQVLQPLTRRVIWAALRRSPDALPSFGAGARVGVPAPVARVSAPLVSRLESRLNGAGAVEVRADLINLPAHLDRVEGWLAAGVLGGAAPTAADLQIASSLALLARIDDLAAVLDRPAGRLAARWFPDYPGRVPAGALPAAWLPTPR